MPRSESAQLNVRSAYARARAHELARQTGMTATQVVEEALREFVPAPPAAELQGLVRKGALLVKPAAGQVISFDDAEAALAEARDGGGAG